MYQLHLTIFSSLQPAANNMDCCPSVEHASQSGCMVNEPDEAKMLKLTFSKPVCFAAESSFFYREENIGAGFLILNALTLSHFVINVCFL